MNNHLICCPNCHAPLNPNDFDPEQKCPACDYRYKIQEGIMDFTPEDHFYWGEISQADMTQINTLAEKQGWFEGFSQIIAQKSQRDLVSYVLDPVRIAGLFHFYDPERNEACLDLGSGWGPIAFGLSKYYRNVYSVDGVFERLKFQSVRAQQDGVENIKIIKGCMLQLPFWDNSMDVVVVNGLLEWIGLSDETTNPRELQMRFLKEVLRVLKPGGKIFIGIENRLGADVILGGQDHSGLRYTSLLPRWLASLAVRLVKRGKRASVFSGATSSYRTWTYTCWGYQKLLQEVGFSVPNFYWTLPGYNQPFVSGTLEGTSFQYYLGFLEGLTANRLKKEILRLLRYIPRGALGFLVKAFSSEFLITASKEVYRGGLQGQVLGAISSPSFIRSSMETRRRLRACYEILDHDQPPRTVLLTPTERDGEAAFIREDPSEYPGRPVRLDSIEEVTLVANWLAEFHLRKQRGVWDHQALVDEISRLVRAVQKHLEPFPQLEEFAQEYLSYISQNPLPCVIEHGNFIPENLRITGNHTLEVMNWPGSNPSGNPWMDSGAFYLALLKREPRFTTTHDFSHFDPLTMSFSRAYSQKVHLPLEFSAAYYVLRAYYQEVGEGELNPTNYISHHYWSKYLAAAVRFALDVDHVDDRIGQQDQAADPHAPISRKIHTGEKSR